MGCRAWVVQGPKGFREHQLAGLGQGSIGLKGLGSERGEGGRVRV